MYSWIVTHWWWNVPWMHVCCTYAKGRSNGSSVWFPSLGWNWFIATFILHLWHLFPCSSVCIFHLTPSICKFPNLWATTLSLKLLFDITILCWHSWKLFENVCTAVPCVFQSREAKGYTNEPFTPIQRTYPGKDHVAWISIFTSFWHKFFNQANVSIWVLSMSALYFPCFLDFIFKYFARSD